MGALLELKGLSSTLDKFLCSEATVGHDGPRMPDTRDYLSMSALKRDGRFQSYLKTIVLLVTRICEAHLCCLYV